MLEVISSEMAKQIIMSFNTENRNTEKIPLASAVGRISAREVLSGENIPPFDRSTVDGFALKAKDTFGCSESIPAVLENKGKILMGENETRTINDGEAMAVPTGGKLPENADAVAMIEFCEDMGDEFCYVLKPLAPKENVISKGDDIKENQIILKKNQTIKISDIGILAATGKSKIEVYKKIAVGIISTGDEIVPCSEKPIGTQMRDVNSFLLCCAVNKTGCEGKTYPVVPDDKNMLLSAVKKAVKECDVVLLSGGSSVGEKDSAFFVLDALGEIQFHGIAIKPGKPTLFSLVENKPVFGLPGHPLAAYFVFHIFCSPLLYKMSGKENVQNTVSAVVSSNIPSNHGREEIVAVSLRNENGVSFADIVPSKSGLVSVLSKADGYIIIPRDKEGMKKGEKIAVCLF